MCGAATAAVCRWDCGAANPPLREGEKGGGLFRPCLHSEQSIPTWGNHQMCLQDQRCTTALNKGGGWAGAGQGARNFPPLPLPAWQRVKTITRRKTPLFERNLLSSKQA
jgi:hypothetical protein